MARRSYCYKHSLTKIIQTDERLKSIYFQIKDNLPEWLNDKITCTHPIFITWCNHNQELLMLIINNFLTINEEKIYIMLDVIKGENSINIIKKYNLTRGKFQLAKTGVLTKVLNTLKTINNIPEANINDKTCDIIANSDIKNLGLPARTYNTLIRNHLYTIAQLQTITYQQLISIPNLGESSITKIEQALGIQYRRK